MSRQTACVILSRQASVILSRQAKDPRRPGRGPSARMTKILRFALDDTLPANDSSLNTDHYTSGT